MSFRRHAAPALLIALWLSSAMLPGEVRAADNPSDIPGVPLPGSVATGVLGGPIYDVVYRVSVQPGYVIVADLTGSAGTDFDLYLFDSTSTTVVSTQGLLAKSIGPTSTESLSYPSYFGGTYYIDLNGATNVEGTYTLSVQLVQDTGIPVASMLLADGKSSVNTTTVTVQLTASANISGVAQMAFSADGTTFGPWQPYTVQSSWTFPPGDGIKRLWAKVMNGVGTVSAPAAASVVLDTQPPSVVTITPSPTDPISVRPTFAVRFSEPIDPVSWQQVGLLLQGANGTRIAGSATYDRAADTATFTPNQPLAPGAVYAVTIGPVQDLAGNAMTSIPSWTIVPLLPTSIALSAYPLVLLPGGATTLVARTTGLDGANLILRADRAGGIADVETGPFVPEGGALSIPLVPTANTYYSLRFLGSTTVGPSQSTPVRVLVRRTAELVGTSSSGTRIAPAGRSIALVGSVKPAAPGVHVSFRLYRYDPATRTYVYASSLGRVTDSVGRASISWAPKAGRWYWRVVTFPTPEFANGASPAYRWTISR